MNIESLASTSAETIARGSNNNLGDVTNTTVAGPGYLARTIGATDGDLRLVQSQDGQISAYLWSATRHVWEIKGHFSNTRKSTELPSIRVSLNDNAVSKNTGQSTTRIVRPNDDKGEASLAMSTASAFPSANDALGRADAIKVRTSRSTPAFGAALPIDISSSKPNSRSPCFAIDRALAERAREAGLYDIEVRDKKWLTRYQNQTLFPDSADAVKIAKQPERKFGQVTYNSFGAITTDRIPRTSSFPAMALDTDGIGFKSSSDLPSLSEFPFLPKSNRATTTDADRNFELKESLQKLASQAEKRNGQIGTGCFGSGELLHTAFDPFDTRPAANSMQTREAALCHGGRENRVIHAPPGLETTISGDVLRSTHFNGVIALPWRVSTNPNIVKSQPPIAHSRDGRMNMIQASSAVVGSDTCADYPSISSGAGSSTDANNGSQEATERFRRHELIYQQMRNDSKAADRAEVKKSNSPTGGGISARNKDQRFDVTRLFIPVVENLASYVNGPIEQCRGYFAPWSAPPVYAIDANIKNPDMPTEP